MIGDSCVGKTALIQRFRDPKFAWDDAEHVATIGVDFVKKVIDVNGKKVMVQTWDTAGQERFRSITQAYYRGSNGAIVCFDCTDQATLISAKLWIDQFRSKSAPDTPVMLVACKADLIGQPIMTESATERGSEVQVIDLNRLEQDGDDGFQSWEEEG